MEEKISIEHVILLTVAVVTLAVSTLTAISVLTKDTSNPAKDLIQVSGHGKVQQAPTKASIYVTVQKDGTTEREAQDQLTQSTAQLKNLVVSLGIPEENLTTQNYSIYETYIPSDQGDTTIAVPEVISTMYPAPQGKTVQRASHTVKIAIENQANLQQKVNEVARAVTGVESVSFDHVAFEVDDSQQKVVENRARTEALNDAREKAQALAIASGHKLGDVVTMIEGANDSTGIYSNVGIASLAEGSAVKTSEDQSILPAISPDEITIEKTVFISYQIK